MAAPDVLEQITLPPAFSRVSELVDSKPEAFLIGDEETRAAALEAVKYVFDLSIQKEQRARPPIAQLLRSVDPSNRPQTRSQAKTAGTKRKRSPSPPSRADEELWRPTPLDSLYLEGMDADQIWAQLELKTAALCDVLKVILEEEVQEDDDGSGEGFMRDLTEEGPDNLENFQGLEDIDDDGELDSNDEDEEEEDGDDNGGVSEEGEDVAELRDPSDSEESDEDEIDLDRPIRPSRKRDALGKRRGGHPILDDGFFSLADFNAEIEEAEAKDVSRGHLGEDEDDDDVAEDDVDLFTTVDDVGASAFEEEDLEEEGEPFYGDFFAPPSRISQNDSKSKQKITQKPQGTGNKTSKVRFHEEVRVKKIKQRGKGIPVALMKSGPVFDDDEDEDDVFGEGFDEQWGGHELDEEEEDGVEEVSNEESGEDEDDEKDTNKDGGGGRETIERLKDDLFAEDEEVSSTKDISTHEARQAELAAQIAEFESQNVAPKEWTLMGEATSRSRPVNSLLEEDLEFERVMKAVPVVTEESVNSLEEIIKKRISENRFDDVIRKRPADDKAFLPSRFFELNDQKSAQSLAQIYEDEYTAAASGTSVDDRDGKLKKEHEALEKMWDNICHKLDALSNAHFTPKQPKAIISTVSNLAATTLESTLPTTKSTKTMLAPEEIFAAPSDIRVRDELTPIEKRTQRNKQRKARKKAKDQLATSVDKFSRMQKAKGSASAVKREKEKALKSVVKTGKGVTVVGKRSTDLKGKTKQSAAAPVEGKRLKL
ncbi:Mpp10 protein [Ramaria rubella]|nr:Mpp10 protein [Ramaria rubella]